MVVQITFNGVRQIPVNKTIDFITKHKHETIQYTTQFAVNLIIKILIIILVVNQPFRDGMKSDFSKIFFLY